MTETVVLLRRGASLVGVLSEPAGKGADDVPAVIILNAGIIHRVGPNRLHVKIARALVAAGYRAFRFDFSGIGDSAPRRDRLPVSESFVEETRWAMDHLCSSNPGQRFVLLGLCSGAGVAFRTACCDERVAGIIGINGSYLEDEELRDIRGRIQQRIHGRYYWKHVLDATKWRRLITGKSNLRKIVMFAARKCAALCRRDGRATPRTQAVGSWAALARREVDSLLVYSEGSTALDVFSLAVKPGLAGLPPGRVIVEQIQDADHVFTLLWSQAVLIDLIRTWMLSGDRSWNARLPQRSVAGPM